MLGTIIDSLKKDFFVTEIIEARHLNECKRTSFTWSDLPNTLCLAMTKEYFQEAISNKNIIGIVAPPSVITGSRFEKTVIVSEKANELFYFIHNRQIHSFYERPEDATFIHPTAVISEKAVVGKRVTIGENVVIHDGCFILDNSIIGDNSVLYHNVTVGTQGFFSKSIRGKKTHIEHFGGVKIGKNCIIHTGTNVSRSVNIDEHTILGNNVHIGIRSNIGHDCIIQDNCDISANVFLAGRVKMGPGCWIGASASISNSVSLGNDVSVKIGSVVIDDVPDGSSISGNFAYDHTRNLKSFLKKRGQR